MKSNSNLTENFSLSGALIACVKKSSLSSRSVSSPLPFASSDKPLNTSGYSCV